MPEVVSMVGDENMETDQETDPNASVSSILCASNTPTSTSVIGNNLFVFEAATGQCFGRAEEAANLDKRLVPVTATQAVDDGIGEPLLTVPAQGRVVIGRVVSASDPDSAITSDTFIIDLSNTHSSSVCVSGEVDIVDASGQVFDGFGTLKMAGDQYERPAVVGEFLVTPPRNFNNCIPPGDTRSMFGDYFSTTDIVEGGVLPNYDSLELRLDVEVLDATAVRGEPLAPGELQWTALPPVVGSLLGEFPYRTSVTVQNLTSQSSTIFGRTGDLLFLDNDGFLLHIEAATIDEFLGVDADELTDEDATLSASGGTVGFATPETTTVLSEIDTEFNGPANRALLHISRCVGSDC